jgi:hypothetical protein
MIDKNSETIIMNAGNVKAYNDRGFTYCMPGNMALKFLGKNVKMYYQNSPATG